MNAHEMDILALSSKYTIPDGWEVFIWECVNMDSPNEGIQFTGAVCNEVFKSGPRKGRKNWQKRDPRTEMKLTMTRKELQDFTDRWAVETGNCARCYGKGEVWQSWSKDEGTKHRECPKCKGTGRAALSTDAMKREQSNG